VVKVPLHSTGAESGRSALFIGQILPVFSLFSPCTGPARHCHFRVSVQRDFHHGLLARTKAEACLTQPHQI